MALQDSDLTDLSGDELRKLIQAREISVVELVESSLRRAGEAQDRFNCFTEIYADESLKSARIADDQLAQGSDTGPFHGLPISIKDFTPTEGQLTTRASRVFSGVRSTADAAVASRLKNAGAIVLAKTTTPEFAYSSFTQSPLWGVTRNPWNPDLTPGGSSGGAAVSVVTGAVTMAEGSDMGGSVRIPAALSGCVGLKPSKGRIPMEVIDTVFDHISHFGPLTRSVVDATEFLRATEGPDERDIQSQINPTPLPETLLTHAKGLRIAVSPDLGIYNVDRLVLRNLERSSMALRESGAVVDWIDIDWPTHYATDWYDYWCVFLAAQYGQLLDDHQDDLDPELVLAMKQGLRTDAVSIERGAHSRTRQWQSMAGIFETYDALICPTTAITAPSATAKDTDFETVDAQGRLDGLDMTAIFNNVSVCPVIAVPNWTLDDQLPTSVQIVGRRFDDPTVLRIAACLEHQMPWPNWHPRDSRFSG